MKKLFFVFLIFAPSLVFADVRINEIAWMGDSVSPDHEWIELYNDSDVSQDLAGWKLTGTTDTDGDVKEKFSISLAGTISGSGYFLIENKRSKNDAAPYLSSDLTSVSFSLINSGEILRLVKSDGTISDAVASPFKTKWEKGDNATKETMQRNGNVWITAVATPRAANKNTDSDAAAPGEKSVSETASVSSSSVSDMSAHASPLPLSDFSDKQEFFLSAGRNRIVSTESPVVFEAYSVDAKGAKAKDLSAVWSFGDGTAAEGIKVSHAYKYPGDYAVILNGSSGGNEAVSRSEIRVFVPKLVLSADDDGSASLENTSEYEVNVGGWKISGAAAAPFVIPSDTIIKPEKKIIFSKYITKMDIPVSGTLELVSPGDAVFTVFSKTIIPAATILATTTPPEPSVPPTTIVEKIPIVEPLKKAKPVSPVPAATEQKISEPKEETVPTPQVITLKKPESLLSKIWSFFFKK